MNASRQLHKLKGTLETSFQSLQGNWDLGQLDGSTFVMGTNMHRMQMVVQRHADDKAFQGTRWKCIFRSFGRWLLRAMRTELADADEKASCYVDGWTSTYTSLVELSEKQGFAIADGGQLHCGRITVAADNDDYVVRTGKMCQNF